MAFKYAIAGFVFGAGVMAQTTDDSNIYTVTDDYFATGRSSSSSKTSMFWTITQRYMDWVSLQPYTYAGETTTYDYTYTRTINPTVTPTVTATYSTSYASYYANVELHEIYYPTGAVAESDLVSRTTYDSSVSTQSTYSTTDYYMPVTMTAPASCPTGFTVATRASITGIPYIVTDLLKPTSTDVSTSTGRTYVAEYATWYLTEGAAPFASSYDVNYMYYIASCTPPPAPYTYSTRTYTSGGGGGSSSGSGSGNNNAWTDYQACYFGGCTTLRTWIIVVATVLPALFLLGFLESWFWYTRLMQGKSAVRCGTVCWVLLSLWVLCFTRMQDARSKEDQKLLQQRWKEMPAGQKFKNWRWGFRRRYPVHLLGQFSKQTVGIVPEGQPLHPAMAQPSAGQVFYYGPPPPGAPGAPGWQQGPNGGAPGNTPQQGYPQQGYPQAQGYPEQGGYHAANVPKEGVVVGSSPALGTEAPQPVYQSPTSPPPQQSAPVPAPPANVSEAPAEQARDITSQAPHATHFAPAKTETNDGLNK